MAFIVLWFWVLARNGEKHIEDTSLALMVRPFASFGVFALLRLDIDRLSVYLRNLKLKSELYHTCGKLTFSSCI
jgi:hypothetical protein